MSSRKERHQFTGPRSAARIERILKALEGGQMTARHLAGKLFMAYATATMYLAHLQDTPRRVRIAAYEPPEDRGRHTPVYALGSARDAVEPVLTAKQKRARAKAKRRADPDVRDRYLALRRSSGWRSRRAAGVAPRVPVDPLTTWIKPQPA